MDSNNIFNLCMPIIFEHEGGFVDNIHDRGGTTKYGISLLLLRSLHDDDHNGWLDGDLNHDKVIDKLDVQSMTKEQAEVFYFRLFWNKWYNMIDSDLIVLHLFDHSVNAGPGNSAKIIQNLMKVIPDGILGPSTVKSINLLTGYFNEEDLANHLKLAREDYYRAIVDKDPSQHVFLQGWINRVESTHF